VAVSSQEVGRLLYTMDLTTPQKMPIETPQRYVHDDYIP